MRMWTLLLLLLPVLSFSQLPLQTALPIDSATKEVLYRQVGAVDSARKDELYFRAKMWIAKYYSSANDAVQVDDKENGIILVKGRIELPTNQYDGHINHTLRISLKDSKYKVEFSDLVFKWWVPRNPYVPGSPYWSEYTLEQCYPVERLPSSTKSHKKMVIESTNEMDAIITELLSTLKGHMGAPVDKGDW